MSLAIRLMYLPINIFVAMAVQYIRLYGSTRIRELLLFSLKIFFFYKCNSQCMQLQIALVNDGLKIYCKDPVMRSCLLLLLRH